MQSARKTVGDGCWWLGLDLGIFEAGAPRWSIGAAGMVKNYVFCNVMRE